MAQRTATLPCFIPRSEGHSGHGIPLLNDPSGLPATFRMGPELLAQGPPGLQGPCLVHWSPLGSIPTCLLSVPRTCPTVPLLHPLFPCPEDCGTSLRSFRLTLSITSLPSLAKEATAPHPHCHFLLNLSCCTTDSLFLFLLCTVLSTIIFIITGCCVYQGNVYGVRAGICRLLCSLL